jgi:hypothetical protein
MSLSPIRMIYNSLQNALNLLSLLCRHRLSPGNGSQSRKFLSFRIPRPYWPAAVSQFLAACGYQDCLLDCDNSRSCPRENFWCSVNDVTRLVDVTSTDTARTFTRRGIDCFLQWVTINIFIKRR